MSTSAWLALLLPLIFTGLVAPFIAYRQAVKVAHAKSETEHRRLDLTEWQTMTAEMRSEIMRLRRARQEDDSRLERLGQRLDSLEEERAELESKVEALERWAASVVAVLRNPVVIDTMKDQGLTVPPPPLENW